MKMLTLILSLMGDKLGYVMSSPTAPSLRKAEWTPSLEQKSTSNPWTLKDEDEPIFKDGFQYFGFESRDKEDDNNSYSLQLFNPPDCNLIMFKGYQVSGQEFANHITNLTQQIQNGLYNGTMGEATRYNYIVWQEILMQEYDGGPRGTPPEEYYLLTLMAKYEPQDSNINEKTIYKFKNTEFLQCVNQAYYEQINNYKNLIKLCERTVFGEVLIFVCGGVPVLAMVVAACWSCKNNRSACCSPRRERPSVSEMSILTSQSSNEIRGQDQSRRRLLSPGTPRVQPS